LLITGGTISTGTVHTVSVCGVYWISSNTSSRNTTDPAVAATVSPSVNASGSTIDGSRGALRMSETKCRNPRTTLRPPVSIAALYPSGLTNGILLGARSSVTYTDALRLALATPKDGAALLFWNTRRRFERQQPIVGARPSSDHHTGLGPATAPTGSESVSAPPGRPFGCALHHGVHSAEDLRIREVFRAALAVGALSQAQEANATCRSVSGLSIIGQGCTSTFSNIALGMGADATASAAAFPAPWLSVTAALQWRETSRGPPTKGSASSTGRLYRISGAVKDRVRSGKRC